MANLAAIKPSERTIEIVHPGTKANIGLRIELISIDDDRMKAIRRKILDRRLHLEARGKHFKAEEIEENRDELVFAAMTGWEWYEREEERDLNGNVIVARIDQPTFEGNVPNFDKRTVLAVFKKLPWLRDQLDKAMSDDRAFFNNSKPI